MLFGLLHALKLDSIIDPELAEQLILLPVDVIFAVLAHRVRWLSLSCVRFRGAAEMRGHSASAETVVNDPPPT